jgi:hypothetical protein
VLPFHEGSKGVRDLEAALLINFGGVVATKHVSLLHFAPQISTAIVEKPCPSVNANPRGSAPYVLSSLANKQAKVIGRVAIAC